MLRRLFGLCRGLSRLLLRRLFGLCRGLSRLLLRRLFGLCRGLSRLLCCLLGIDLRLARGHMHCHRRGIAQTVLVDNGECHLVRPFPSVAVADLWAGGGCTVPERPLVIRNWAGAGRPAGIEVDLRFSLNLLRRDDDCRRRLSWLRLRLQCRLSRLLCWLLNRLLRGLGWLLSRLSWLLCGLSRLLCRLSRLLSRLSRLLSRLSRLLCRLSRLLCRLGWLLSRLAWNFDLYLVCCGVGLSSLIGHGQSDLVGTGGVIRVFD